jgi:hypothetical protein
MQILAKILRRLGAVLALLVATANGGLLLMLIGVGSAFGGGHLKPLDDVALVACAALFASALIALVAGGRASSLVCGVFLLPFWVFWSPIIFAIRPASNPAQSSNAQGAWVLLMVMALLPAATVLIAAGNLLPGRAIPKQDPGLVAPAAENPREV